MEKVTDADTRIQLIGVNGEDLGNSAGQPWHERP
jgi:hypothetical protein